MAAPSRGRKRMAYSVSSPTSRSRMGTLFATVRNCGFFQILLAVRHGVAAHLLDHLIRAAEPASAEWFLPPRCMCSESVFMFKITLSWRRVQPERTRP